MTVVSLASHLLVHFHRDLLVGIFLFISIESESQMDNGSLESLHLAVSPLFPDLFGQSFAN